MLRDRRRALQVRLFGVYSFIIIIRLQRNGQREVHSPHVSTDRDDLQEQKAGRERNGFWFSLPPVTHGPRWEQEGTGGVACFGCFPWAYSTACG
jgi:hypothetical protein